MNHINLTESGSCRNNPALRSSHDPVKFRRSMLVGGVRYGFLYGFLGLANGSGAISTEGRIPVFLSSSTIAELLYTLAAPVLGLNWTASPAPIRGWPDQGSADPRNAHRVPALHRQRINLYMCRR